MEFYEQLSALEVVPQFFLAVFCSLLVFWTGAGIVMLVLKIIQWLLLGLWKLVVVLFKDVYRCLFG